MTWVQVIPMPRVREDEYHHFSAVGHAFGVSDEAGVEAVRAEIQANQTGNHYRNHSVKVPTAPGEPVRGLERGGGGASTETAPAARHARGMRKKVTKPPK